MANDVVRAKLAAEGVRQWQLARMLKIGETTLVRRLREELPEDEQQKICNMIDDYVRSAERRE